MRFLLVLVVVLVGCESEGEAYCACVIQNNCWSDDSCLEDPLGSCQWVKANGDIPAYAEGDESKVCYGVNLDCSLPACGEAPEAD